MEWPDSCGEAYEGTVVWTRYEHPCAWEPVFEPGDLAASEIVCICEPVDGGAEWLCYWRVTFHGHNFRCAYRKWAYPLSCPTGTYTKVAGEECCPSEITVYR